MKYYQVKSEFRGKYPCKSFVDFPARMLEASMSEKDAAYYHWFIAEDDSLARAKILLVELEEVNW